MITLLTIFHVIVCVFLILVVLLQQGKGADWAGAFGGGGTQFGDLGIAVAGQTGGITGHAGGLFGAAGNFASGTAGSVARGTLSGEIAAAGTLGATTLATAAAASDAGFRCAAISPMVERCVSCRRSAWRAISRYTSGRESGMAGSPLGPGTNGGFCVSASTNVAPSDHTSAFAETGALRSSGAS